MARKLGKVCWLGRPRCSFCICGWTGWGRGQRYFRSDRQVRSLLGSTRSDLVHSVGFPALKTGKGYLNSKSDSSGAGTVGGATAPLYVFSPLAPRLVALLSTWLVIFPLVFAVFWIGSLALAIAIDVVLIGLLCWDLVRSSSMSLCVENNGISIKNRWRRRFVEWRAIKEVGMRLWLINGFVPVQLVCVTTAKGRFPAQVTYARKERRRLVTELSTACRKHGIPCNVSAERLSSNDGVLTQWLDRRKSGGFG